MRCHVHCGHHPNAVGQPLVQSDILIEVDPRAQESRAQPREDVATDSEQDERAADFDAGSTGTRDGDAPANCVLVLGPVADRVVQEALNDGDRVG